MKTSSFRPSERPPARNMKELKAEKRRLQREIVRTETGIRTDYRNLVEALTFRNIINTLAEEIMATNLVVSQAYSIISPLFKRKKKKKKDEGRGTKDEGRET
ncbi:MAG: hypothetical protein ABIJ04_10070 [Bacteroidota bacterium]